MLLRAHSRRAWSRPKTFLLGIGFLLVFSFLIHHYEEYISDPVLYLILGDQHDAIREPNINPQTGQIVDTRALFAKEARELDLMPGAGAIYGNTLATLVDKETRPSAFERVLSPADNLTSFALDRPYIFSPYPDYNSVEWKARHEEYVPCIGPSGGEVEDARVFKGRPSAFPEPGFGSYEALGLDGNLCFERDTWFGQYGQIPRQDMDGKDIGWERVDWGALQRDCRERNKARFPDIEPQKHSTPEHTGFPHPGQSGLADDEDRHSRMTRRKRFGNMLRRTRKSKSVHVSDETESGKNHTSGSKDQRTAFLLRSYTGKQYNDNDKEVIRSMITELSLRSGGEFEVFLFVHVKESSNIWGSAEAYRKKVEASVPEEFWGITVLWDDESVKRVYRELPSRARKVHYGQYLPVQMFMQEHQEFDHVWNWEMDSRVVGHHYDMLTKLGDFSRNQPRRGLWERNERFYIPSFHGDYDTDFRKSVERAAGRDTIWGAPDIPVIHPAGPKPPVASPEEDDYEWGVGEEADLITLGPMFDVNGSNWILRNYVWGYRSPEFDWKDLPRRATVVSQVRLSRRLLDVMHYENSRGNQLFTEMAAQTVALVHGLKAVFAPMPVFFDRPWRGEQLAKWFNGGPTGGSGGRGSAFGWGEEERFLGTSWYYRTVPPQRMYNNWMGYEDNGIGGTEWEAKHGRPCLPSMLLHPVKEVVPTAPGYSSDSKLPY